MPSGASGSRNTRAVRARLRDSLERRFRARGVSLTFCDFLRAVKERVLTVAAIPNSGSSVKTKAINNRNVERLLKVTDSFPIQTRLAPTRIAQLG